MMDPLCTVRYKRLFCCWLVLVCEESIITISAFPFLNSSNLQSYLLFNDNVFLDFANYSCNNKVFKVLFSCFLLNSFSALYKIKFHLFVCVDMDALRNPPRHDPGRVRLHHPLPRPQPVAQEHLPG